VTGSLLRRHWPQAAIAAALLAALLYGALAPLREASRELLFEIPAGTYARRMKGEQLPVLPSEVRLTLGVRDVLLLRNRDSVPQVFGPVLVMPGQDFRLPFEQAADYQFACAAHASGQMTVRVVPMPDPGWGRLRWRAGALLHAIRFLPIKGPDRQ
jgi:hypothetical protein